MSNVNVTIENNNGIKNKNKCCNNKSKTKKNK